MVDGVPVFARLLDENPSLATSGLAVETVAQSGMEQGGLGGGADSAVVSAGEHHEDEELVSLRSALALVGDVDTGLLMRAAALAGYHSSHQFCSICGKATRAVDWGRSRQCDSCDTRHFPRIDPAVIVAIKDDSDRLLLGHHVGWEDTRRSLFAGFVEAGESVEQAIHRELAEEVGLEVDSLVYAGSQPWPMPRSLMLGFWAHAEGEVRVDGEEITNAAWYTRQSLQEAAARGEVTLPPRASIAARLVQQWLDCPDVDGR
jgi:NAD+ diphosphatase